MDKVTPPHTHTLVSKPPSLSGYESFHKLDGFLVPSHAGVIICDNDVLKF